VIHLQPDQGAFDDGKVTVVQPGAAVGEPGCTRSQAEVTAVPYREVSVLVVIGGAGQVAGSVSAIPAPCMRGLPLVPG
jgi:hypothetical protein